MTYLTPNDIQEMFLKSDTPILTFVLWKPSYPRGERVRMWDGGPLATVRFYTHVPTSFLAKGFEPNGDWTDTEFLRKDFICHQKWTETNCFRVVVTLERNVFNRWAYL